MPLTRIRQTAIGADAITTPKLDDTAGGLTLPGTQYVHVPVGTTAQRPSSPANGHFRYNTDFERLEQYANGQWQSIDTPPSITSLSYSGSITAADPAGGETITLTGTNFQAGATVTVGGTSATSVSVVSSTSITFTTPAKTAGDYDVGVTNSNGLAATLLNGISYNGTPAFTTAAGNVGSIAEDVAMSTITIVAAEPDGGTLAYSVTSGALPTGVSLGSANGQLTGTPNVNPTANTTFNFTVTATDDENQTNSRAFNLIVLRPIYATQISNSLRFNNDDSAHLRRTFSSGNQQIFTLSGWIKRSTLGLQRIFSCGSSGTSYVQYRFDTNDNILISSENGGAVMSLATTQKFRDFSAWYHLTLSVDTTQATASNRVKLYVNGEQVTDFSTSNYPTQNTSLLVNSSIAHYLGTLSYSTTGGPLDGYMSDVYFVDGQQLAPTSFAEEFNGVWTPKAYSGTFGTNGFHLPFIQGSTSGNSAFFSDAGNSYVQFSDASNYDIASGDDFTIEFFFNLTDTGEADYSYIFGNYAGTGGPYLSIQYAKSANSFYFYYGNGQSYSMPFGAGNVVANRWHHLAINRTSGTMQTFLDGTRIYNGTNTTSWDNNNVRIGQAQSNGATNGFDGYLSNVRMVVGSAVYAAGTTITVPTSTLTSVTDTQLLALTTSTITEDASPNNVTGTLSGSGYFSSTLAPFGDQFYNDASTNGNNFNINGLSSTDVVSDSPTNNFSTNNGIMRANITHSEGNLKMVGVGNNYDNMASTFEFDVEDADGWYWEYRSIGNDVSTVIGIAPPENARFNQSDPATPFSNIAGSIGYLGGGQSQTAGSNSSYGDSWTAGDIIGIAVKAGSVYFYKNGTIQNSGTAAATGLTGRYVAAFAINGTNSGVSNYGQDSTFAGLETPASNSDANGLGEFAHTVPTGYKALCQKNIPESTINTSLDDRPEDYFNAVLWTGNGSTQNITNVGFQPDFVWLKQRNGTQTHQLLDTVRGKIGGANSFARLRSDTTASQATPASDGGLQSMDSNGFTLGSDAAYNGNTNTYVGWSWKAGGAPTASNVATSGAMTANSVSLNGTLQSAYTPASSATQYPTKMSINTKAGFSIVSWTGNGSAGTWLPHGLNSTPEMMILKGLDDRTWSIYHKDLTSAAYYLSTASSSGESVDGTMFNSVAPNNERFVVGSYNVVTNVNYIGYFWHSVPGYSKFGSYTGNGSSTDGTFVYTGFRPSFVLFKRTNAVDNWVLEDNKRNPSNLNRNFLLADASGAEGAVDLRDFLSNGFKMRGSAQNTSGGNYIYMAFAEDPFKYAEAR